MTAVLPSCFDTLSTLGLAYSLSGRAAEGLPLLEQSVDPVIFRQSGGLAFAFRHLGEGYLLADRPDDALAVGVRGLEYARGRKDKGAEAWIVHLLGEVASHDSRLDASSGMTYWLEKAEAELAEP